MGGADVSIAPAHELSSIGLQVTGDAAWAGPRRTGATMRRVRIAGSFIMPGEGWGDRQGRVARFIGSKEPLHVNDGT